MTTPNAPATIPTTMDLAVLQATLAAERAARVREVDALRRDLDTVTAERDALRGCDDDLDDSERDREVTHERLRGAIALLSRAKATMFGCHDINLEGDITTFLARHLDAHPAPRSPDDRWLIFAGDDDERPTVVQGESAARHFYAQHSQGSRCRLYQLVASSTT
jgi:hypothetical protein